MRGLNRVGSHGPREETVAPTYRRWTVVVGVLILLAAAAPAQARSPEARVARWVNIDRAHHGAQWLARSWPLARMAEHHSRHMGANDRISAPDAGNYLVAAARPGHLWTDTVVAWRSSTLRRVLRGDFTRFGVGVARYYGRIWVTVIFR